MMSFVGTWMNLENHRSQRTNTRTENQTPHVLTHRRVLNNKNAWTQGEEHHTLGAVGGCQRRKSGGWGGWGGIKWGEMSDIVCTYATTLHDLYMYPKT